MTAKRRYARPTLLRRDILPAVTADSSPVSALLDS
jgi:hypothetical protein